VKDKNIPGNAWIFKRMELFIENMEKKTRANNASIIMPIVNAIIINNNKCL